MKTYFDKYKTLCCKSKLIRLSRANYKCSKCNKDETMNFIYFCQANIKTK